MRTECRALLAGFVLLTGPIAGACGGRTMLVPAYQIGRLSDDAVIANDADVRIMVRTDEWRGIPTLYQHAVPVEVTIDNGGAHSLDLSASQFALVAGTQHLEPLTPAATVPGNVSAQAAAAANRLASDVLRPGERRVGFLYFGEVGDVDEVVFEAELRDSATGVQFGRIAIPFSVE